MMTTKQQETFTSKSVTKRGFIFSPFNEAHTPSCWLQNDCCCFIDGICFGLIWIWILEKERLDNGYFCGKSMTDLERY